MCPILLKLDSRIKIPLTFAKSLNKEKWEIHHQLFPTVLNNKAILGYISGLTFFLLKESTHINPF